MPRNIEVPVMRLGCKARNSAILCIVGSSGLGSGVGATVS